MPRLIPFLFTVNDAGNREPITVTGNPRKVTIIELNTGAAWPTTDYEISNVISGGTAHRVLAGFPTVYLASQEKNSLRFDPNEII